MSFLGVIDYGMGNLKSICNAFSFLGRSPRLCSTPEEVERCERLIIPGVGAYQAAMRNLHARGMVAPIRAHAAGGKPLLGICLGMQLFSSVGCEPEKTEGFDLIAGEVRPLPEDSHYRVPHVGWNATSLVRPHPIFAGIKTGLDWYFVHSFHFITAVQEDTAATTEYGISFVSIVARRNILGVQFHPEKSQEAGRLLFQEFLKWNPA